jgi:hypothetical protein
MKKLVVLSMAILFVFSVLQGQQTQVFEKSQSNVSKKAQKVTLKKLKGTEVSDQAKDSFFADFGTVPGVQWRRVDTFDEAVFTADGKEKKAFYDSFGKLVGTTTVASYSDLPASGRKEIEKQYKDYTVGRVIFYDDNEHNETDMILYGAQFADEDNYFVEMIRPTDKIILQVNMQGEVFWFTKL